MRDNKTRLAEAAELKTKINTAKKQIEQLRAELGTLFDETLAEMLKENESITPGRVLKSIRLSVNNHEFNDGDATEFYLHYRDGVGISLIFDDDAEVAECGEPKATEAESAFIYKLSNLFGSFDIDDFFEFKFSNSYERLIFGLDNTGKLKILD
jgi:hypothetical protein